ncbi:MAG: GNAT family N-acetyltransferase [Leptospiraceae bacterium]|nr:GNAT family N-acetyltransferase [Leptospiraceae bacterium]MDW8306188.1 N-acetyltransferase [Leptospiraceae bacterium]
MVQVRKATLSDIHHLLALEKLCFSSYYNESQCVSEIENCEVFVLNLDQRFCGYLSLKVLTSEAEIRRLAIHPEFRRKKLASYLLNYVEHELRKSQVSAVFLEVELTNEPARLLYEKAGFIPLAIRKNYYGWQRHALCMKKDLFPFA